MRGNGKGEEPAAAGRRIVDVNRYMTLATADADGRPWPTPVWFAHTGYEEFWWVSRTAARHSRNLRARAEIGIVVFDSTVPAGTGRGVYVEAIAGEAAEGDLERGIAVYSERSVADGGRAWTPADVTGPAHLRLYRAQAVQSYVLSPEDQRIPFDPKDA